MEYSQLKEGAPVEWTHYPPEFMDANPKPTPKTGIVTIPAGDGNIVAEDEHGTRFVLKEQDGELVSGAPPATSPAPASAAASAAETVPEKDDEPEPGEIPTKVQTPIGVEYFGPAFHQAVDMLVEILGPEWRAAGHFDNGSQDDIRTVYCMVIETGPDLDQVEQALESIQAKLEAHAHTLHFGEVSILNEDEVEKAITTTSAGTLPVLRT
jgi:hypothetical protein